MKRKLKNYFEEEDKALRLTVTVILAFLAALIMTLIIFLY